MNKNEIKKLMNEKYRSFDLDEGAKNASYKYLKFVDKYNEETWLFFLSPDDVCTHTKLMSDFSNLDNRLKDLNKNYKKTGNNKWLFVEKGITYTVDLVKEEWFFSIVIKKK